MGAKNPPQIIKYVRQLKKIKLSEDVDSGRSESAEVMGKIFN